ncbi:MAG TPA: protein translocase subunit SecF [Candidatus Baltobacteraceae bacterium]|nr:protein translocase subunit SecF [Candidatus Baltobacteraceae bacterium]
MEILGKTNFDFIGKRHIAYLISGVLVFSGILALVQISRGAANMGIDFAGGTSIQVKFQKPVDLGAVRDALGKNGIKDSEPQQFADGRTVLIRLKRTSSTEASLTQQVQAALKKEIADNPYSVEASSEVGPAIGKDLQHKALIAIVMSLAGIVIYIAWRFQFDFGVAATIATFHDVLAVLGIVFLLQKEITLLIVTALLTIAGYSLTDTVVVYDRIRENLRSRRKQGLGETINASINQVLSRTAMTSLTVLLSALALFLIGGEVLHDFGFALLLGVVVGTYSSWFVASPLIYEWRARREIARRPR